MRLRDARKKGWFRIENVLFERGDLDLYEKIVYVVLCRFADDRDKCFPSLQTVATAAGCSKRKAADAINSLVAKNLILKTQRTSEEGDLTSNEYTILSAQAGDQEGVLHDMLYPMHDMHHRIAPHAIRVLHDVQPNNTQFNNTHTTTVVEEDEKTKDSSNPVLLDKAIETIKRIFANTPYKSIPDKVLIELIHQAAADKVMLTAEMVAYQSTLGHKPKNPTGEFRFLVTNGMDTPPGFISSAEKARRKHEEIKRKIKEREEGERIKQEEMPPEVRKFIKDFCKTRGIHSKQKVHH
ncbi:MAG: helix-turn-helix domain-containing protein [Nitrospirota bacterium]